MIRVSLKMIMMLTAISTLLTNPTQATCSRCIKIETERAQEQALHPQSWHYYDDLIGLSTKDDPVGKMNSTTGENSGEIKSEEALRDSTDRSSLKADNSSNSFKKAKQTSDPSKVDTTANILALNLYAQAAEEGFFEENDVFKEKKGEASTSNQAVSQSEESMRSSPSNMTSANISSTSKVYSTIYTIFKTKNFLETLDGEFTLFIPTNQALQQLPSRTLSDLVRPENADKLAALVSNHLVAKKLLKKDFTENTQLEVKAISGKNLTLASKDGKLFIDDIQILHAEAAGFDGVIYVIDKVLLP